MRRKLSALFLRSPLIKVKSPQTLPSASSRLRDVDTRCADLRKVACMLTQQNRVFTGKEGRQRVQGPSPAFKVQVFSSSSFPRLLLAKSSSFLRPHVFLESLQCRPVLGMHLGWTTTLESCAVRSHLSQLTCLPSSLQNSALILSQSPQLRAGRRGAQGRPRAVRVGCPGGEQVALSPVECQSDGRASCVPSPQPFPQGGTHAHVQGLRFLL